MSIYDDLTGVANGVKTELDKLKTRGLTAKIGYYSSGDDWPLTSKGVLKPCAIIELPGLSSGGRNFRPITGAKDALYKSRFNVMCVAATAEDCIKVVGMVADALVGFQPTPGASEINLLGSAMLEPAMQTGAPTRYAMPIGFTLAINAIVV